MNRYDFLEADEWFWTMFEPTLNWQNFTFGQLYMRTRVINYHIWLLRGYMSDFEQCSKRIQLDLIHLKWWQIWASKMTTCVHLWNKSKKKEVADCSEMVRNTAQNGEKYSSNWWEIQLELVRNTARIGEKYSSKWWEIQLEMVRNTARKSFSAFKMAALVITYLNSHEFACKFHQNYNLIKLVSLWTFLKIILLASLSHIRSLTAPLHKKEWPKVKLCQVGICLNIAQAFVWPLGYHSLPLYVPTHMHSLQRFN